MDYVPIRVSTLRGEQKIDFDAYVKINDKFVLYLRRGDSFEGERLTRLKSKKLKKMFIIGTHEEAYRQYLARNIERAYDKNGAELQGRSEIIQGHQQSHGEAVMENPEDPQVYAEAKDAAGRFTQFLQDEGNALSHVLSVPNLDQSIAHHGVSVSTMAVALAKKLGIQDPKQLQLLTLGALLHDFEHFHSGISLATPVNQMPPETLAIYKQHPLKGVEKVRDKRHFDQTVINIIAQHEEDIQGGGFPSGLKEKQMDPLAIITGCCNALDRIISFEGKSRKEALKQLTISSVGKYPLNHLQTLTEIMNSIK